MDNFSSEQYDRFEAYRRHALPKQAVRKVELRYEGFRVLLKGNRSYSRALVIKFQHLWPKLSQVSPKSLLAKSWRWVRNLVLIEFPVYTRLFCLARAVQERRGETGPLSPDHLREAYHMYQVETGRVGAARPLKSKRLFCR